MAKSKNNNRSRRDNTSITNRRLPTPTMFDQPLLFPEIEDRRQYHPEGVARPARSFSIPRHRLAIPKKNVRSVRGDSRYVPSFDGLTHEIGFRVPRKVLICVRRRIRKQVLHAFRKTGKAGQRKPRRNFYSSVSCRS